MKPARLQKGQYLIDDRPVPHQPGVGGMHHQEIAHAFGSRAGDGDLAVVGTGQQPTPLSTEEVDQIVNRVQVSKDKPSRTELTSTDESASRGRYR